ncbi:MAG: hypothetical protein JWM95_2670 [Gemmatimonadetes bacterium]|nr:hypothetical protein [Gemmatimonadota bacterium]
MKYMCFIKHAEKYRLDTIPQGLMDAMGEFVTEQMKSGVMLDTAGLKPTSEAWKVNVQGGKMTVIDGPFSESKEIVGGYALIDVKSKEEAMAVANRFVELHVIHWPEFEMSCEVRPLEDM